MVSSDPATFLAQLTPQEANDFRSTGRRRRVPRGTVLFHEGDTSDRVVLLLAGQVKVSYYTNEGREVVLAIRGPGELVGELGAIDGHTRSATATALDPADVHMVDVDEFRAFLEAHPRVALLLLQMVSGRLRDADRKRIEYMAHDTVGQVASRLVEMAERFAEASEAGVQITLPISQEELAGWTGSSREAASKALAALRNRGWIETQRRRITILDLPALRARAT